MQIHLRPLLRSRWKPGTHRVLVSSKASSWHGSSTSGRSLRNLPAIDDHSFLFSPDVRRPAASLLYPPLIPAEHFQYWVGGCRLHWWSFLLSLLRRFVQCFTLFLTTRQRSGWGWCRAHHSCALFSFHNLHHLGFSRWSGHGQHDAVSLIFYALHCIWNRRY